MFTFLLVLLVIDSFVLIAAILLQSGKGNGLAASFGGVSSSADPLLGQRQEEHGRLPARQAPGGELVDAHELVGLGDLPAPRVRALAGLHAAAGTQVGA